MVCVVCVCVCVCVLSLLTVCLLFGGFYSWKVLSGKQILACSSLMKRVVKKNHFHAERAVKRDL